MRTPFICVLVATFFASAGCDDTDTVRAYPAPKDPPPATAAATPTAAGPAAGASAEDAHAGHEEIEWDVPAGWTSQPAGQMRYAAFAVSPEHKDVVLTVIPLPLDANPLLPNVNRWQGQLGLPQSAEADLPKVVSKVDLKAGAKADTFDATGKDPKSGQPLRMLAAIVPHEDKAWFFKVMGPPEVIEAQKAKYDAFLQSIRFHDHGHDHAGHDHGAPAAEVKLAWGTLPAGWTEDKAAQQFRLHTIKVTAGGETADLAITRLPLAQAGSLLDNLNRWRTAVGLEETQNPGDHAPKEIRFADRPGAMFEVAGKEKQVVVGMTDSARQLWFFKLQGPAKVVEGQKAAFEAFLKTVRFVGDER